MSIKGLLLFAAGGAVGVLLGAYFFIDVRARDIVDVPPCTDRCIDRKELGGLLVALGIIKTPALVPKVVAETDLTIAMESPDPLASVHYLVLPKKDILDVGDLSKEDSEYIADAFMVMSQLVRRDNLDEYKVIANGPGFQQVRYLHFNLVAQ